MLKYFIIFFLLIEITTAININEIMYNPEGEDNNREFIEIYGTNNLTDFAISDLKQNDTLKLLKYSPDSEYSLIVEDEFDYTDLACSIYSAGLTIGNNLNNEDTIYLYKNDTLMELIQYNDSLANNNGFSLEIENKNIYESLTNGGTPCQKNNPNIPTKDTEKQENKACNISISIKTEKEIYPNNEKIVFYNIISEKTNEFIISYWIEDLFNNIIKAPKNTTNLNKKEFTPKITEREKAFIIKNKLFINCNNSTAESQKLITVLNNITQEQSSSNIIYYPLKIKSNQTFSIILELKNNSTESAPIVTVTLSKSKKFFEKKEIFNLKPNEKKLIKIESIIDSKEGEATLEIYINKNKILEKQILIEKEEIKENPKFNKNTPKSLINSSNFQESQGEVIYSSPEKKSRRIGFYILGIISIISILIIKK